MRTKLTACCGLLAALFGAAALAQPHPTPKTKPVRRQVLVRRHLPPPILRTDSEPYPFLEEDYPRRDEQEATTVAFDSTLTYTYVAQMPMLNGQPFTAAKAAIEQQLVVPPAAPDGRVFVSFDVSKTGLVRNVHIVKGLRADVDSAVVTATRQLPRFTPGQQNGHVVAVRAVAPITIPVQPQP